MGRRWASPASVMAWMTSEWMASRGSEPPVWMRSLVRACWRASAAAIWGAVGVADAHEWHFRHLLDRLVPASSLAPATTATRPGGSAAPIGDI